MTIYACENFYDDKPYLVAADTVGQAMYTFSVEMDMRFTSVSCKVVMCNVGSVCRGFVCESMAEMLGLPTKRFSYIC